MRRTLASVLVLAVAVIANADWMHFQSQAGRFSVDLPEKPSEQSNMVPVQGVSLKTLTYMSQAHGALALITATDFPKPLHGADATSFAKSYIDSFIRSAHATESSRKSLSIHGYSGQVAYFTLKGQTGSVWAFTTGKQGYGISVMVSSGGLDAVKNRVYNSFKTN